MTRADLEALCKSLAPIIKEYTAAEITKAIEPLRKELADRMVWRDTWSEHVVYNVGNTVNHGGDMWVARLASIGQRPGADADHWQLAVRRGKPGRDGRDLRAIAS